MIGSQPSPSSTTRRRLRAWSTPENHTGRRACAGLGSQKMSSNRSDGESKLAGVCSHSARQAAIVSVSNWPRRSKSTPSASYSSRCQPVPTPRSTRPPESTSSVATLLARSAAGRNGAMSTPVASRTDDVAAAMAVSAVSGSSQGASGGCGNRPHA